ncbi:carbohydrate sulfotransferase 10-like isoform X2 [Watersipora subatra]|uniref:carbohydrate sulfotransferase 10-like isoform X2 n=1 Tax=Watersipora subatra TaxID=2589382 RepID=UPI00355B18E0
MGLNQSTTQRSMAAIITVQAAALYYCLLSKSSKEYVENVSRIPINHSQIHEVHFAPESEIRSLLPINKTQTLLSNIEELLTMKARNKRRTQNLREFCRKHNATVISTYPSYAEYELGFMNYIWMASPKHHLLYCATPKCGSTMWKSYLLEDLHVNWTGQDTHVAATKRLGIAATYKSSGQGIRQFLRGFRPDNRVIIVRNPWARLASAYDDKIVAKAWELKFIDCILQRKEQTHYESHTHPLTSLCALCLMDYNIILKLEELEEAEPFLMKRLNFTINPKYRSPRKMKNNAYRDKYLDVTSEQIRQLQVVYKYDIELFNYPQSPLE